MPEHPDIDPDEWGGVALEAHMLVHGDRGALYDHPALDFQRTADVVNGLRDIDFTPADVALTLIAVKLARISYALEQGLPYELWRDSVVDVAGYAEALDGVMTYELEQLDDDDDDDDGGEDDEPEPLPLPDGGDAEKVDEVSPVLSAEPEPIEPDPEPDDIDITDRQAPPAVC